MLNPGARHLRLRRTDAVDPLRGITPHLRAQARLKAAMIANAQRTYVVADSSKLGEHGLFHYWSESARRLGGWSPTRVLTPPC
ncbi:MAG: hypothetical protein R2719_13750 [Micropruina sp.]